MPATSEPASGSLMASDAICSPRMAGSSHFRFCSSVPNLKTGGVAISACTATAIPSPPLPTFAISSDSTTAEK